LVYGIQHRTGIIVITGEIGTGKTTLCRTLLTRLDQSVKTALILNPYFSDTQLLQLIVKDLGLEPKLKNKLSLVETLNDFLLEQTALGNNVVLIIDEAQNLKARQLEQIRLLSNLETEKAKLLQIVLVGQPELLEKLKLSALRQLTQRISVRYHILPLASNEVTEYIRHRLNIASKDHAHPKAAFTPEAVELIFQASQGTPRLINIICDRALLAAFVKESNTIDKEIIEKCTREVFAQGLAAR